MNSEWTASRHCGPGACQLYSEDGTVNGVVRCSYGGYGVGDRCDFDAGQVACSADRTQMLECTDGETTVKQTCPAGQECRRGMQNGKVILHCAASGYRAGDLCHFPEGALLCDVSQTAVLACKDEKMVLETKCDAGKTCQPAVLHGIPIVECR